MQRIERVERVARRDPSVSRVFTDLRQIEAGGPVTVTHPEMRRYFMTIPEEGVDVDITCSGVRPGEKLYEEVFFGHEAIEPTAHPKVLRSAAVSGERRLHLT